MPLCQKLYKVRAELCHVAELFVLDLGDFTVSSVVHSGWTLFPAGLELCLCLHSNFTVWCLIQTFLVL